MVTSQEYKDFRNKINTNQLKGKLGSFSALKVPAKFMRGIVKHEI